MAIEKLHEMYGIPHVIVTSIRDSTDPSTITVVGSSARSDHTPRIFRVEVPAIDCYFSGTGDMFAALTVVRLREASTKIGVTDTRSWLPADNVSSTDLPLAKATERVLTSMQAVLRKTKMARDRELARLSGSQGVLEGENDSEKRIALRRAKAAEVRVVRCLDDLKTTDNGWKATIVDTLTAAQRRLD